ncbi:MAG: cadherin-like domain-containing protein, partial [Pseudomonadota bacterium]
MSTSNEIAGLEAVAVDGGLVYHVSGNSTGYQWKLSANAPGVLWTDDAYSVLDDCVGLSFADVNVELGADGAVRVVPKGGGNFTETMAEAPRFAQPSLDEFGFDQRRPSVEDQLTAATFDDASQAESIDLAIPAQWDDLSAEVSFDVASFLPENLLNEGLQVSVGGLPPGLSYNVARMRVEGRIADDAMTGQPYQVSVMLGLPDGSILKTVFHWTVRDAKAVDSGANLTAVVPASGNRDEAASAGILMSVATHGVLAATSLSLASRADAAAAATAGRASKFEVSDLGSSAATAAAARGNGSGDRGAGIDNLIIGSTVPGANGGRLSQRNEETAASLESRDGSQQVDSNAGDEDDDLETPANAPLSSQAIAEGFDTFDGGGGGTANARPFAGTPAPQTVLEETLRDDINVLSAAFDADGDTLSVVSAEANNGQVAILSDGRLSYLPNELFNGTDTITYQVSDGRGGTDIGLVTVTVLPVNDDPTVGAFATQPTLEDVPILNIDVLANALDVDSAMLSVTQASATHGVVTINPDGTLSYQPNQDYNGPDTISFTVSDGDGGTGLGSVPITVTPENDAPNPGTPAAATVAEDNPLLALNVLTAASDADGDTVSVVPGSVNALSGVITENPDGTFDYTPVLNFNGVDTITYDITDGSGLTSTGSMTITVTPVNDDPVSGVPGNLTTAEDTAIASIDVLQFASDIDLDVLVVNPASVTVTVPCVAAT